VLAYFCQFALPQVPQLISYQAQLTDSSTETPMADGIYQITFSIYDVTSGGTALWVEIQDVSISKGIYNVQLGLFTPLNGVFNGFDRYLGVQVESDPEMTPRNQITSVAYALSSENAATLDGMQTSDFAEVSHSHIEYFGNGGEASGADRTLGNTDNYGLGFLTNSDTSLYINNNGNVCIGEQNPNNILVVKQNSPASSANVELFNSASDGSAQFVAYPDDGAHGGVVIGKFTGEDDTSFIISNGGNDPLTMSASSITFSTQGVIRQIVDNFDPPNWSL